LNYTSSFDVIASEPKLSIIGELLHSPFLLN
jgi:hypothetical protein